MSTTIRRRPSRTVPSVIVALALLVAAVGAVWAGVTALSGDTAAVDSVVGAAGSTWSSQAAYIPAVAVALIGIVLIITALVPGHHDAHLIRTTGTAGTALRDKGLETLLADHAGTIDGVDDAKATVKGRKAEVRVDTYLLERDDLRSRVTTDLRRRVDELDLEHAPRIAVTVNTRN